MREIFIKSGPYIGAAEMFRRVRNYIEQKPGSEPGYDLYAYVFGGCEMPVERKAIPGGNTANEGGPVAESGQEPRTARLGKASMVERILASVPGSKRRTVERILVFLRYGDREIHEQLEAGWCSITTAQEKSLKLRKLESKIELATTAVPNDLGLTLLAFRNSVIRKPGGFVYWDPDKDFVFQSLVNYLQLSGYLTAEDVEPIHKLIGTRLYNR